MCERSVRIIKRDTKNAEAQGPKPSGGGGGASAERAIKTVISGWVREHGLRAEEYRRGYAALLKEFGFR